MNIFGKPLPNYKLQLFIICVVGLLTLKFVTAGHVNFPYHAANELLLLFVLYFAVINGAVVFSKQNLSPLPMIVGIAIAGLISLLTLQNGDSFYHLFRLFTPEQSNQTVMLIINCIYAVIVVLPSIYIYLALRSLFFLKQKKNLREFFNSFIIFLLLSSVTAFLKSDEYSHFSFIYYAFMTMTYILVVVNAMRISWITFLPKKQKYRLLMLSVALVIIFIMVLNGLSSEVPKSFLQHFSFGIMNFMTVIAVYGLLYFIFLFFSTLFHLPTAEAIDRKTKEVSSLQNLSKLINQVFDPKELTATVTDLASQMVNAESSWILLNERSNREIASPKNITIDDAGQYSQKIIALLPKEFSGVKFVNVPHQGKKEKNGTGSYSVAVAAIKSHAINAGLLISMRKNDIPFDAEDRKTLEAFADSVAIAFENSRLLHESIEKERLEKELDVAREMQRKLIPEILPKFKGIELSAAFIPAFEVGGDYYDFFPLNDAETGFVIADVSGKGISAAFIMAEIRGIFEILSKQYSSPKGLLGKVNAALQRMLDRKHFITAIYGILNEKDKTVTIARAGHTSALHLHAGEIISIIPKGIGLGISYSQLFDDSLEEYTITLSPGDILAFYTDGVTESMNEENEDFGVKRLSDLLLQWQSESPGIIQNKILESLTVFSRNMQQHDDITALLFKMGNQ